MLDYFGLCCLYLPLLAFAKATNSDLFSVYNDKDTNSMNSHITKKIKPFPHDSFELAFPFFNELFPMSGLDAKPKESFNKNNLKDEKNIFLDLSDPPEKPPLPIDDKSKKKMGKDKLIMSFTELFIPFQNHKNQYDFNNGKRNNFFDDIFNSFPFIDFEGGLFDKYEKQSTKKRRLPKRKFEKNIIRSANGTSGISGNLFENNELEATPRHSILNRLGQKFVKSPDVITLFSKYNNSDDACCDGHSQCHTGGHCSSKKCKVNHLSNDKPNVNNDNSSVKKPLLLDKTFLICAIPGLIGFGALIFGIEVLRRHNELVKQTPFLSQYNQVQTC